MLDRILEKFNVKYEDISSDERETLNTWVEAIQKSKLTPQKVREFIVTMREAVERELTKTDHNTKQDIFLKARLRNYLVIEGFLTSPEKAEQQLELAISGFAKSVDKK